MIAVVFVCLVLNFTLADYTDCWYFARDTYKENKWFENVNRVWETSEPGFSDFLTPDQQKIILTKADLNTAMLNLKKYCCEKKIWWVDQATCDIDKSFFNPNAMDSQYLFDHIFDVVMRRLAWLTGDKNIFENTNMVEVDDKWKEWRDFIADKAEDLSWSDAQSIIDKYQKYWVKSNPNLWYDIAEEIKGNFAKGDELLLKYVADENGKVSEALKNYDKWTLYDRYGNACALSMYFYALLNYQNTNNSDRGVIINRLSDWRCENLVQSQIENENRYVQVVLQNSANLFMENYIEWYMQYLYDRSVKFKSLWKNVEDRWMDVIRAVPYLLKTCVK